MGKKLSKDEFVERAVEIHGSRYNYDSVDYKNNKTKVSIGCNVHGIFLQRPFSHLEGEGCYQCFLERNRMPFDVFFHKAFAQHGARYTYSSADYVDSEKKIEIICPKHGSFYQSPYAHARGQGCPSCCESKGEREVYKILSDNGINFVRQWTDHDCAPNGRKMQFDFYLPDSRIVIEYDGEQHHKPVSCWGGIEHLIVVQNRDRIKDLYCRENEILMIRISYKDNIYEKIGDFL